MVSFIKGPLIILDSVDLTAMCSIFCCCNCMYMHHACIHTLGVHASNLSPSFPPHPLPLFLPLGVVIGFSSEPTVTNEASGVVNVSIQLFHGMLSIPITVEVYVSQETGNLAKGMHFYIRVDK